MTDGRLEKLLKDYNKNQCLSVVYHSYVAVTALYVFNYYSSKCIYMYHYNSTPFIICVQGDEVFCCAAWANGYPATLIGIYSTNHISVLLHSYIHCVYICFCLYIYIDCI